MGYEVDLDNWTQFPNLPLAAHSLRSTTINGNLALYGGQSDGTSPINMRNQVVSYIRSSNQWYLTPLNETLGFDPLFVADFYTHDKVSMDEVPWNPDGNF